MGGFGFLLRLGAAALLVAATAGIAPPVNAATSAIPALAPPASCSLVTPIGTSFADPPTAGTISVPGEEDCYTFPGAVSDRMYVDVLETSGPLTAVWRLVRPDGSSGPCGLFSGASDRDCALDQAGDWAIVVKDSTGAGTGAYTAAVRRLNQPAGCGVAGTSFTAPLNAGSLAAGEADCYTFSALAADRIRATVLETSGPLTAVWRLVRPDGSSGPCGLFSGASDRDCALDQAGDWTIVVKDSTGSGTGTYTVKIVLRQRPPGDFDGGGDGERSVFRPSTGQFFVRGGIPEVTQYGIAGDVPVPADYNGDGVADKAVYRPSTGQWFIRDAAPAAEVVPYGAPCAANCALAGDIPVPADYDGDRKADIAVYRPSTGQWFIRGGSPEVIQYGLGCGDFCPGTPTEIPVPGDYDGDGRADIAIYRTTTGQWFIRGGPEGVPYGTAGDRPVPGDYNGDSTTDIAVYRPSTGQWFVRGGSPELIQYGVGGACCDDVPVPADYNGGGTADIAVYRRSTGQWFVRGGSPEVAPYGAPGDIPLTLPYAIRTWVSFTQ